MGEGIFLATAPPALDDVPWHAWDINPTYAQQSAAVAAERGLRATIAVEDAFDLDGTRLASIVRGKTVMAVGNPPWVTSASQGSAERKNLPRKWNRFGLSGLDAMTGKSNFDTAEAVLLAVLDALQAAREIRLAFLVKRSVALKMSRDLLGAPGVVRARFSRIDAKRFFGASVEAGLFEAVLRPRALVTCNELQLSPSLGAPPIEAAGIMDGRFVTDIRAYQAARDLDAPRGAGLVWRQGIKHDLARVLELRPTPTGEWANAMRRDRGRRTRCAVPTLQELGYRGRPGREAPLPALSVRSERPGSEPSRSLAQACAISRRSCRALRQPRFLHISREARLHAVRCRGLHLRSI